MSMKDYAVNDYGFLMTSDMMKAVASKVCDNFDEDTFEADSWDYCDEIYTMNLVEYISSFTGEAIELKDDGTDNWSVSEEFGADCIYYIPVKNMSTLFKSAYENMEELVEEFKERLKEYLPEDFEYRKYIRHIVGTYYG